MLLIFIQSTKVAFLKVVSASSTMTYLFSAAKEAAISPLLAALK